jgi:hypothetical protein
MGDRDEGERHGGGVNDQSSVIPGRAERREPGIQKEVLRFSLWIPDRRVAASGMTNERRPYLAGSAAAFSTGSQRAISLFT